MNMKRLAVIFIMLLVVVSVSAQTDSSGFYVQSFKKLEWDLDARSNYPVLDQNNRKAALIKVVIPEAGFDFDVGVMGVVGVKQEVGEVWVYVPEGVRKITIRHQNYGVIRGYEFSFPIESAAVYEMRLHVPVQPKVKVVIKDSIVYVPTPVYAKDPQSGKRISSGGLFNVRKQPKWSVLAVTNVPTASFGHMTAWHAHKVGAYFKGEYKRGKPHDDLSQLMTRRKLSVTIGGIFKCTDWLGICSGIGYGEVCVPPGSITYNDQATDRYKILNGFSLDLGATARFGHISAYLGGNAIHDWKGTSDSIKRPKAFLELGIGYSF